MDFGTLLHMAKKNNDSSYKESSSYYSTKFAPPKKESKEKKLSNNIQKFLQKREQEERERKHQEKEKLNNLLAMRDEKSKNKIKKMLKVTKSANKSVLDDCHGSNTAVTLEGPEQPDQDDYGYVSNEANAFYQKYIEKVKDVKEDKGFAPSRPVSVSDLKGTKERVKAAITREIEEKKGPKQRISHSTTDNGKSNSGSAIGSGSSTGGSQTGIRAYGTTKCLYDPVAERQEEERRKREEEQKKAKQKKPPPPVMDFQALLKLAEKKQYEPIELPTEVKKSKEPERLLTSKEKRELEERKRAKEARERREKEKMQHRSGDSNVLKDRDRKDASATPRMEPNGRIPKLGQPTKPSNVNQSSNSNKNLSSASTSKSVIPTKTTTQMPSEKFSKKPNASETHSSAYSANGKGNSVPAKLSSSTSSVLSSKKPSTSGSSSVANIKKPYDGPTREFPPRDMKSIKARPFPPPDLRRSDNQQNNKSQAHKRRILDDDEEYDSEMDDFIDDGEEVDDYSTHIKAIFGYDKSKYRDLDDYDDRAMESNFAQVQREEFISKKIGLQEDLEDMRLEAMEKKRKMSKKKKTQ